MYFSNPVPGLRCYVAAASERAEPTPVVEVRANQGHHPDGSSVQQHSAGDAYPFILAVRGEWAEVWAPSGEVLHVIAMGASRESRMNAYRRGANLALAHADAYRQARANR